MRKTVIFFLVIIAIIVISALAFNLPFAGKPEFPVNRDGVSEPERPKSGDDPSDVTPIAGSFEERRQLNYEWVLKQPTSDDRGAVWTDIVKLAAGEVRINPDSFQATLGAYAVVFTNNPDSLRLDDKHRPSFWMANGRQPRTGQVQNVLISRYEILRFPSAPTPLETRQYTFIHACFTRWAFNEVVERNNWIFFRRTGDGNVALYSHEPYQ